MTYDGNNFEDAIVISDRLVRTDVLTSIHIDEYASKFLKEKLNEQFYATGGKRV